MRPPSVVGAPLRGVSSARVPACRWPFPGIPANKETSRKGSKLATSTAHGRHDADARTPAQWYALLFGVVLLLVGLLSFISDSTFDTGSDINGDKFLGFEVNGWHNLVHIASGLFLLAVHRRRDTAKTGVLAFGLIYAVVTIIGMIDGDTVLGILPVNAADNILHLALSVLAIAAALASDSGHDAHRGAGRGTDRTAGTDADSFGDAAGGNASARFERTGTESPTQTRP